jgi:hypothetical protein
MVDLKRCSKCFQHYRGRVCPNCHPPKGGRRRGGKSRGSSGGQGRRWSASLALGHDVLPVNAEAAACNQVEADVNTQVIRAGEMDAFQYLNPAEGD